MLIKELFENKTKLDTAIKPFGFLPAQIYITWDWDNTNHARLCETYEDFEEFTRDVFFSGIADKMLEKLETLQLDIKANQLVKDGLYDLTEGLLPIYIEQTWANIKVQMNLEMEG